VRPVSLRARSLLQLCCIVALLLSAQHSAFTHALWHVQKSFPAQHREHSEASAAHDPALPDASSLCMFDAAFGEVLGGAPATHYRCPAPAPAAEAPRHSQRTFVIQAPLAPRSRGPPSLL